VLSFLMYVPRAARVEMHELIIADSHRIRERNEGDVHCDRMRIFNFEGELFFGSSPEFETHLEQIEEEIDDELRILILRVKYLRNPDAVCMHLLDKFIERTEARGIVVVLSGVRGGFYATLEKVGIVERLGDERVFREVPQLWTSTAAAVEWAHRQLGDDLCDTCPRREQSAGVTQQWHFDI